MLNILFKQLKWERAPQWIVYIDRDTPGSNFSDLEHALEQYILNTFSTVNPKRTDVLSKPQIWKEIIKQSNKRYISTNIFHSM